MPDTSWLVCRVCRAVPWLPFRRAMVRAGQCYASTTARRSLGCTSSSSSCRHVDTLHASCQQCCDCSIHIYMESACSRHREPSHCMTHVRLLRISRTQKQLPAKQSSGCSPSTTTCPSTQEPARGRRPRASHTGSHVPDSPTDALLAGLGSPTAAALQDPPTSPGSTAGMQLGGEGSGSGTHLVPGSIVESPMGSPSSDDKGPTVGGHVAIQSIKHCMQHNFVDLHRASASNKHCHKMASGGVPQGYHDWSLCCAPHA